MYTRSNSFKAIFLLSLGLIVMAFAMIFTTKTAFAQECLTGDGCLPNRGCVNDFQPNSVCTANDVTIALVFVNDALPVCQNVGDTATVYLEAQIAAGSKERYDIGLFVALDGGSALLASRAPDGASCYHDYLRGPLSSAPTTTPPRTSPFMRRPRTKRIEPLRATTPDRRLPRQQQRQEDR